MFKVGPGFVALEMGMVGVVVCEGCGGEVGGYVIVSAVVGACVHGCEGGSEVGEGRGFNLSCS